MSGWRLRLRAPLEARADLSGLTPERLVGFAPTVAKTVIPYGTRAVALGDLFDLREISDDRLVIEADDARLDGVGAGLGGGEIVVAGRCGAYAGAAMTGGLVRIEGDAGGFLGAEMSGGRIEVAGSAGECVGAARAGSRRGMTGGAIMIGGDAGPRAGERQRAGLVTIAGSAGPGLATAMRAGTIAVGGRIGEGAGGGMQRGTIFCRQCPENLDGSFGDAGPHDFVVIRLLARRVPDLKPWLSGRTSARRLVGDLAAAGQGEILILEA